jgi:2-polyprenyl-6-methoxyphenol hydroxylase-like FAD-dependent oxidoreductase
LRYRARVKIACIGGGPAGLYLGILVRRAAPEHEVTVYERNRPADTFGFGVVFSDATLGNLAAADPETHREISARFTRWDDIEIHAGGEVLRSTGHGFCGIERKALLQILDARARALGVRVVHEREIGSIDELVSSDAAAPPDVIVACDGVGSTVRAALAAALQPEVDLRPNKFVWLGCTVPYRAFTFLLKVTRHGLLRVHAYPFHARASTFIVECREDTWRAAGLAGADEETTVAKLSELFAPELAGHALVANRSIWRNFPTVRCAKWHTGNVVLLGDAAHTAHFSIGSGTKLAMEDAIALRDELLARGVGEIPGALAAYEARRRPEVEALQAAAQASLEWFEGAERYLAMAPIQLTYSLMTRSLRVSHASVARRDPHLARGVEALLAAAAGLPATAAPPRPAALPAQLGDRRARSRRAAPTPDAEGAAAIARQTVDGVPVGIVVSPPLSTASLDVDDPWRAAVVAVHAAGALIAARTVEPTAATVARAAALGFDLLLVDGAGSGAGAAPELLPEQLPARVLAARAAWRPGGPIAARLCERRARAGLRHALAGHAAQLVRAGADLLWVAAEAADSAARLAAAPLADRLRNELSAATCVEAAGASISDLEALLAGGRADLIALAGPPE